MTPPPHNRLYPVTTPPEHLIFLSSLFRSLRFPVSLPNKKFRRSSVINLLNLPLCMLNLLSLSSTGATKMSGGGGPSKLGIALAIIVAISLLALFAEVFYVLWRRRVFRRQANSVCVDVDEASRHTSSESTSSSKELLYFFCVRPQFCLERSGATADTRDDDLVNSNQQSDMEVIDIDLLKIQGMFGPPRFLFTIKEEEREDLDSPAAKSTCPVAQNRVKENVIHDGNRSSVCLDDCFRAAEEPVPVAVEIDDRGVDEATPFSTPCASPLYFTPSASPVHDEVGGRSPEQG